MIEKCCANCKHYCEGSGKMTTCLNAHYEYECHEPDYVCERWVGKGEEVKLIPTIEMTVCCPRCGNILTELRSTTRIGMTHRCMNCELCYSFHVSLDQGVRSYVFREV